MNTICRGIPFKCLAVLAVLVAIVGTGGCSNGTTQSASSSSRAIVSEIQHEIAETARAYEEAAAQAAMTASAETPPKEPRPSPTRYIAQYGDVLVHSPIQQRDLTGILFHQASYEYGLVMTTTLPEADAEAAQAARGTRINKDQLEGDWVDADALHLYRSQDSTAIDTSIDVGAAPSTTVYAPVSGTVVLVKDYMLYGYCPDIEIHIQPDGHPELDVVMLHTQDPIVKAGDRVEGGITPISFVRPISDMVDDIQLGYYTPDGDLGNHTHIQVNDANYPGYREGKLAGATLGHVGEQNAPESSQGGGPASPPGEIDEIDEVGDIVEYEPLPESERSNSEGRSDDEPAPPS